MDLSDFRKALDMKIGQKQQLEKSIQALNEKYDELDYRLAMTEKAQYIIQQVAKMTQEEITYHISDLVTMAINSVFGDEGYEFDVAFDIKRGKTECQLNFKQDKELIDPIGSSGGGIVDIASFGLRVALWSLSNPRLAKIIILDEPFKHLSANYRENAAEMLKAISDKLNLQLIMVTHDPTLVVSSKNIIEISNSKGVAKVDNNSQQPTPNKKQFKRSKK